MSPNFIRWLHFHLSEHPSIVHFRWSTTATWGATWSFLVCSIAAYAVASAALHFLLRAFRCRKPLPLGYIPAIHSLAMSLISSVIFAGILFSSAAEIRDTRWLWRRSKTPFQWLLCFPLGTRHSGRVFFWSYAFYHSRFIHIFGTMFAILRNPEKFPGFQILNHSVLIVMSFLWLEFSQSFQVLAILSTTLVFSLIYGGRFLAEIGGVSKSSFPCFAVLCRIFLLVANLGWHLGVLVVYFWKGGCHGMAAWMFNAVINSFLLLLVLNFYGRSYRDSAARLAGQEEEATVSSEIRGEQVMGKWKILQCATK